MGSPKTIDTAFENAAAEVMYRIIKTEFDFKREFVGFQKRQLFWLSVNLYNDACGRGSFGCKAVLKFVNA